MNKHDDLYRRIINRLNSSKIEYTDDKVSVKLVEDCVRCTMENYNKVLYRNQENVIKLMNKSLGYTRFTPAFVKKDISRVINIINKVTKDGEVYIIIELDDGNKITLTGDYSNVVVSESTISGSNVLDAVAKWKYICCIWLGALEDFAYNFPGVEMSFGNGVNNEANQIINDGFLKCTINVIEPEKIDVTLASVDDYMTSRMRCKKYSELHDYIAFYNEELKTKVGVSIDELNPFVKSCVIENLEYFKQVDDKSFTLSK